MTDHYARQAQRNAEVAIRPPEADSAALRAARVRLRAIAQRMTDTVNGWIDTFDEGELQGNAERLALDYQAELAAYLPEIRQAASEAELADIAAEITAITSRAASSGDIAAIEQQREVIERQREVAEREARWAEASRKRDQEQLAAQQRAEVERQRQAAIAARAEPKAIQGTVEHSPAAVKTRAKPTVVDTVGPLIVMIDQARKEKARRLAECGPCDFRHRKPTPAARLYGISAVNWQGQVTGARVGTVQARACAKHFAEADIWIETATVPRGAATCYWELGS